jgi:hypothetical protein
MKGSIFTHQWVHDQAEAHFLKHFDIDNREPTMFLSTTEDLLRALNIACHLHCQACEDIVVTIIDLEAADLDARRGTFDAHHLTHAEAMATKLGWEDAKIYHTEWLFLGRIKQSAVVKHIHYQHLVDHGLYNVFPSLALPHKLRTLRQQIIQDFEGPNASHGVLSRWIADTAHPTGGSWVSQWNPVAEAGKADGRRCAQFAALFDLRLPDECALTRDLMLTAWKWKQSPFYPPADYEQAFEYITSLYLPV